MNNNLTNGFRLAWILARQDLTSRYAGSYAGFFWNIGVPLFNAIILATIFSILMGGRLGLDYGNAPFVMFYFVAFSLWMVFNEVVSRSTGILKEYSYLINKIAFPFWVLPMIPLASAILGQVIVLLIITALTYYLDISIASTAYMYVLIWFISILFTIGVAYAVSAISVYFPDMSQIVPLLLNVLFWMTPILYPPSLIKQHAPIWLEQIIININPFYYISEYSRYALLSGAEIPGVNILFLFAVVSAVLVFGIYTFHKLKPGFADVI